MRACVSQIMRERGSKDVYYLLTGSKRPVHLLSKYAKSKASKNKETKLAIQQLLGEAILDVRTVQNLGVRASRKEIRKYNEKKEREQEN